MKTVPTVSSLSSPGDAGNNGNSYALVFPALPALKALDTTGANGQSAVSEKRSTIKTSTANEVFTIIAEDRNLDECEQLREEKYKHVCRTIARENKVEMEMSTSKNMDLTFLVRGKRVDVDQAKRRIIASFQTQITRTMNVSKEHHSKLMGKQGAIRKDIELRTGARIQIPSIQNTSENINVTGRKDAVEKAVQELEGIILKLKSECEEEILIDQRHHGALIGVKGQNVKQLQEIFNVKITFPRPEAKNNLVKIRGLNTNVNKALKSIAKLAEALDEANFVLKIPVFKRFHKLICRKRELIIKKIREETNTRIDLRCEGKESDVIKVMGNKRKVLIAYDMIRNIQNEIGDIVAKEMVLENVKVRNVIVNLGNKFIRSIKEDCGDNVTLKLPTFKGDNTIVIKGPEDDVKNVITQIQTMVDEVHKYVFDLKVKPEFHKYLIGTNRVNVKRIRDLTSTRIIFPPKTDMTGENITIVGKKENVDKAKAEFEVMITDISNVIEEHVEIHENYHRSFLVNREHFLHKLEKECGGVRITFPKPGAGNKVVIKGSKADVALAKQRLLDHANVLENTIQVAVNVDPKYHYLFFARRGEVINRIVDDCNGVSIIFPKLASNDSVVTIKGNKTNVEEAKRKIEGIVKNFENMIEITVNVTPRYHHFIAHNAEVKNQKSGA